MLTITSVCPLSVQRPFFHFFFRLTLIHMAYFWPIFAQGITQLLMVGFSKFFFCLKDLEKFLLKIDDRTSLH